MFVVLLILILLMLSPFLPLLLLVTTIQTYVERYAREDRSLLDEALAAQG